MYTLSVLYIEILFRSDQLTLIKFETNLNMYIEITRYIIHINKRFTLITKIFKQPIIYINKFQYSQWILYV